MRCSCRGPRVWQAGTRLPAIIRLPIQSNGAVPLTISLLVCLVLSFDAVLSVLRVGGTKFALPCLDPPCTPCICGAALSNKWTLRHRHKHRHIRSRDLQQRGLVFFLSVLRKPSKRVTALRLCQRLEFREKLDVIPFRPPFLASSPILNRQASICPTRTGQLSKALKLKVVALHCIRYDTLPPRRDLFLSMRIAVASCP